MILKKKTFILFAIAILISGGITLARCHSDCWGYDMPYGRYNECREIYVSHVMPPPPPPAPMVYRYPYRHYPQHMGFNLNFNNRHHHPISPHHHNHIGFGFNISI